MLVRNLARGIYSCHRGLSQRLLNFKSDEKDYGIVFDEEKIQKKM